MWNADNRDQFDEIVADLLLDSDVQSMKELPQHSKTVNCLDHSVYVAYLSFLVCRRLGLNYVSAARAGLLHDFYLCKWPEEEAKTRRRRLWLHPHKALENAEQKYELSKLEKDIIVKHMWPLTRPLPKYKETLVVSCVDKLCAVMEMCRLYRVFKVHKHLASSALT